MLKFVCLCNLFASLAFVSLTTFANDLPPPEVNTLIAKFKMTMMDCPEKIWADYDWKDLKVVSVYPSTKHSWLWDASSNSLLKVTNDSLPPSALGSLYHFFEVGGQRAMSLNMEDQRMDTFQLGVHEFFHYHGQKNWKRGDASGGRGTHYPVSWQPRIFRRMIFDSLKNYIVSNHLYKSN